MDRRERGNASSTPSDNGLGAATVDKKGRLPAFPFLCHETASTE